MSKPLGLSIFSKIFETQALIVPSSLLAIVLPLFYPSKEPSKQYLCQNPCFWLLFLFRFVT